MRGNIKQNVSTGKMKYLKCLTVPVFISYPESKCLKLCQPFANKNLST